MMENWGGRSQKGGGELERRGRKVGRAMVFLLQILDDSRLSNFALDCKIVNCIDVFYRFDKDSSG